jgi:hypothetical protein
MSSKILSTLDPSLALDSTQEQPQSAASFRPSSSDTCLFSDAACQLPLSPTAPGYRDAHRWISKSDLFPTMTMGTESTPV